MVTYPSDKVIRALNNWCQDGSLGPGSTVGVVERKGTWRKTKKKWPGKSVELGTRNPSLPKSLPQSLVRFTCLFFLFFATFLFALSPQLRSVAPGYRMVIPILWLNEVSVSKRAFHAVY